MRTLHFQIKQRSKGTGQAPAGLHVQYITRGAAGVEYLQRTGAYAAREDLVATGHGNLPGWAENDPVKFFAAADTWERNPGTSDPERTKVRSGRVCVQIDAALPRELSSIEQQRVVQEFLAVQLGDRHAHVWAIHQPTASDGQPYPHVHIAFSERRDSGKDLGPQEYFSRTGNQKERDFNARDWPSRSRQAWSDTLNLTLERTGCESRVDPRNLRAQGISREAVEYLSPSRLKLDDSELRARPLYPENYAATHAYWTARKATLGMTAGMSHAEALQRIAVASQTREKSPQESLDALQHRVRELQQQVYRIHGAVRLEEYRQRTGQLSPAGQAEVAIVKNRYVPDLDHPGKEQTRERGSGRGF